jgi:hypothetical protein
MLKQPMPVVMDPGGRRDDSGDCFARWANLSHVLSSCTVGQIKALCVDVGWFAAPEQAQISVKARALKK